MTTDIFFLFFKEKTDIKCNWTVIHTSTCSCTKEILISPICRNWWEIDLWNKPVCLVISSFNQVIWKIEGCFWGQLKSLQCIQWSTLYSHLPHIVQALLLLPKQFWQSLLRHALEKTNKLCCGIWHEDVSGRFFKSCMWWAGWAPWIRLVCLAHPTDVRLGWYWGTLEAGSSSWTLCAQTFPPTLFQCSRLHDSAGRCHCQYTVSIKGPHLDCSHVDAGSACQSDINHNPFS